MKKIAECSHLSTLQDRMFLLLAVEKDEILRGQRRSEVVQIKGQSNQHVDGKINFISSDSEQCQLVNLRKQNKTTCTMLK